MVVDDELLDAIWQYCTVSVAQTRGLHACEFCQGHSSNDAERKDQRLLLGSAEIRVFSATGDIYAAPNLIYHYMLVHRYRPPDEFVLAAKIGPPPPSPEYFAHFAQLGLRWNKTLVREGAPVRFRYEKTSEGIKKVYDKP
jgi:hypothetical protein